MSYTNEQHRTAERLRSDAAAIERAIDELHTRCAHMQRDACALHAKADAIVPIEHARKP